MTPATIALSVLCGGLAVAFSACLSAFHGANDRANAVEEIAKHDSRELRKRIAKDAALLSRSFALLRDERSNCRTTRESWKTEIAELENDWRKG